MNPKVEVAAAGMNKDDFNIHLTPEHELVISVEKKNKDEENKKKYLRREFSYSKFQQTMSLPDDVDTEKINASVNNGVLTIVLPKKVEQVKPSENKSIEIH